MTHHLTLVRDEKRGTGIEGRLFVDGKLLGPTLERIGYELPPGVFGVHKHASPKFQRDTIWIDAGRGWTLIHRGLSPEWSEGCVLLGRTDLDGARLDDGSALVTWLEGQVFGWLASGEVLCTVCEIGGDVADGVLE